VYLVKNLDLKNNADEFWGYMMQDGVITNDMREIIESKITTSAMTGEFLRIIQMRGPRAFENFMAALRKAPGIAYIADKLEHDLNGH